MTNFKLHNKGFTLIELLVVISVLGILAAVALVSFTGSQKQARDVRRKSDVKQYQLALENFANKGNSLYPLRNPGAQGVSAANTLCGDLGLTGCPQDPRYIKDNTFDYRYQSNGVGSTGAQAATIYVLWGKLENVPTGTTKYWVVCTNGKSGELTGTISPVNGVCPI